MIIPSMHSSRVARAAAGGGSDATPAAVNWANVGLIVNNTTYVYSAQQITEIDTTITLRTTFSGFDRLVYKVQSTSTVPASNSAPTVNGYTNISNNGTLTVSNNQWLVFCARVGITSSTTVTVTNTSDGNATLDTFTAQSRSSGF